MFERVFSLTMFLRAVLLDIAHSWVKITKGFKIVVVGLFTIILLSDCASDRELSGKNIRDVQLPTSRPRSTSMPVSPPSPGKHTQETFTAKFKKAMLTVYNARSRLDLERAVKEFNEARSLNSLIPEVYYNLGLVYFELDEYAQAVDCFNEYLRLAPGVEDADRARTLLATAQGLQLWIERARRAMLNPRAWRLLDHKPAELDHDWFPTEFRQAKDGKLQIKSPRHNWDLVARDGETRRNPWLTLNLKGRRFYYTVCAARENVCQKGYAYVVVEGELLLENGRTLLIARLYSITWKSYADEYYQKGDMHYKKGGYSVGGAERTVTYELVM